MERLGGEDGWKGRVERVRVSGKGGEGEWRGWVERVSGAGGWRV